MFGSATQPDPTIPPNGARPRQHRRPLPDRRAGREGRHGHGLQGLPTGPRTSRRAEGPARVLRGGAGLPGALPPRGGGGGQAAAPEHPDRLRPRPAGRPRLHRHRVRRWRDPVRAARAAAAGERSRAPAETGRLRARLRARAQGPSPRRQALERAALRGWGPGAFRLRPGPDDGQRRPPDPGRHRAGDARVHVARAVRRHRGRAAERPVLLAVVAFEMLTGRVPFTAETPAAVILAQIHNPLPLARQLRPDLSAEVETVLQRGMAKVAADRFESCSALVAALEASAGAEGAGAPASTLTLAAGRRAAPPRMPP